MIPRAAWWLGAFAALNLVLSLLLWDLHSGGFLLLAGRTSNGSLFTDSFVPMYRGVQAWSQGAGIYENVFFEGHTKLQYPPTALLLMLPFRGLPEARVNLLLGQWVNMAFLFLTGITFLLLVRRLGVAKSQPGPATAFMYGSLLVLLYCFHPFGIVFTLGQIQAWINCLLILTLLFWLEGRESLAGVAVGLCALIKPSYGLLLIWGLLRRRWRFAAVMAAVCLAGGLAALSVFGAAEFVSYARVLSYIGKRGESFFPNQSFNGLMHRLLHNGNNLTWEGSAFPPYHPAVHAVTVVTGVLLLGSALAVPLLRRARVGSLPDLCVMLLSLTMASPVAWQHHYGWAIAACVVAFLGALRLPPPRRWQMAAVVAASLLVGGHWWRFVDPLVAATPFNVLQSYVLLAMLAVLGVLWHLALSDAGPGPAMPNGTHGDTAGDRRPASS
jgi:alpha-1,2-mannosyltransferase